MRGLLDTSVFVGEEQKRELGPLPDQATISVMTLAELHVGVLLAKGQRVRALRLRTLARVERAFDPLPVDDSVARAFAEIVADARRKRRQPRVVDALIAATAVAYDLPLYSQDRDFELILGVELVLV
ncbi:MAG TPA: PIN domain-containing protein [Actinomycetota bacterium]